MERVELRQVDKTGNKKQGASEADQNFAWHCGDLS
jgi:hypothetical protein